ncbi:MAG: GNAT family N-acetyltransferase, partial [Chloroflexi bacterium]|nr:GNAT family N-acetyltransferase [Chloroflexota bacterium]
FWWIQSVYVDRRVRSRGVFRSLYDHIRNLARREGKACGLRLYVHHENHRAIQVYRNLGMNRSDYVLYEEDWSAPAVP